jgi:glycosyltransferase involved in cell wall biosynthesis
MNKPFKMLYASSYDRGLEHLLRMWPQLKAKIPTAELHIAYGWDMFLKGYANNPEMMKWKDKIEKLMEQSGITHHGRVSKSKLDEITANCDLWVYPTHFQETNCITALRSQSLGCVPVTMNLAALQDTVFSGIKIDGDIEDQETKDLYLKELTALAKDPKRLAEEKVKAIEGAKAYSWDKISTEWTKHFK